MFGMAKKPRTRRERIVSVCALVAILVWGIVDAARSHGAVRFGTLVMIGAASMTLLREIKELLEEPS